MKNISFIKVILGFFLLLSIIGCHSSSSMIVIPTGTIIPDLLATLTTPSARSLSTPTNTVAPRSPNTPFSEQFILEYKPGGEIILQDVISGETRMLPDIFKIYEEGFLGWTNHRCGLYVRMENYDIVEIDLKGKIVRKVFEAEKLSSIFGNTVSLWAKPSPDETHLAFILRDGERKEYSNYGYHFGREELMLAETEVIDNPYSISSGGGAWIYAWSSDSSKIAFTDFDTNGNAQVYITDLLSRHKSQITNFTEIRKIPSKFLWSPEGKHIAMLFPRAGPGWDVVVKNTKGSEITTIEGIDQFWWNENDEFGLIRNGSIQLFDSTSGSLSKEIDFPASKSTPKLFGSTHRLACLWDCFGNKGYELIVFDMDSQEITNYPNLKPVPDIAGWEVSDLEFPGETNCR